MSFTQQLKNLLHPYAFVLKESDKFKRDSMSYDLMLLQINHETIKSPLGIKKGTSEENEFDVLRTVLPNTLAQIRNL